MKKTLTIALIAMTFGIFTALTFDYLKEKRVHVYDNQPVAGSLWWDDGMVEPIPVEGYLRWDHDGDENLEIYTGKEWISTGVEHENM